MSLSFKDKVVVVTGAGGGLGKFYCIEYAKRGAKVVVNDLGGSLKGDGASSKNADVVVDEIRNNGGIAVADYNNVLDGDRIIKTAIDNFGRVDVLINNAGILRDSSFAKMSDKDFQLVLDVHLNGAFKVTKAAWPYMRDQKYGRIINTASPAGLFGNFGQANYSAAKLGLIGLAETLAKEGAKYNILTNGIAPLARSRMTESVLPPHILEKLGPEKIAPLVLYLTHESNTNVNGDIFEVAAGYYSQIRWERSGGTLFKPDKTFTPELVKSKFDEVFNFGENKYGLKTLYPRGVSDFNYLLEEAKKMPSADNSKLPPLSLKGKVVLITGSGAGLGRDYALFFARCGASVVINDFKDPSKVVAEIKAFGGEAHGDKHDVANEAELIMENVLNKYGRLDVLINNAGILRDKSFLKMSDAEWNRVLQVHLWGTYKLCKLAWPIFVKQNFGRIVNITSTSGIYGSFGQANYAAAKCAIVGFSRTLAIEGAKKNIFTNIVAPHAETAMTLTIFKEEEMNKFSPDQVAPLLVVLSDPELKVNGELFEAGAGWIGNTRWQRAKGFVSHAEHTTPEDVRDNWADVVDFSKSSTVKTTTESSMGILAAVEGDEEDDDDEDDEDAESASSDKTWYYDDRDVILYNIGVGAKAKELNYTYENSKNFQVVPSFATTAIFNSKQRAFAFSKHLDNFNAMFLLHGEHYFRANKFPIPTSGALKSKFESVQIVNKGSNVVVVEACETVDEKGEPVFYNESTLFIRNSSIKKDTVFRQRPEFAKKPFNAPTRAPDFEIEVPISEDQASFYRLTGDRNPLHIDPAFAKGAKFPKPILHGMCSFGLTSKVLTDKYGGFDEAKLRLTGIVFPGETLIVKAWKNQDVVTFQTWVKERNSIAINNAAVKLVGDKSKL